MVRCLQFISLNDFVKVFFCKKKWGGAIYTTHGFCSSVPIHNATESFGVFGAFGHAGTLRLLADVQFYLHNDSRFEVIGVLTGRHHLSLCIVNAVQGYRGLW